MRVTMGLVRSPKRRLRRRIGGERLDELVMAMADVIRQIRPQNHGRFDLCVRGETRHVFVDGTDGPPPEGRIGVVQMHQLVNPTELPIMIGTLMTT